MTCFANVAIPPRNSSVHDTEVISLPSCKEKRLYFKIHQNTTLVIDWYTRCDCRHFGDCAVWQYLFRYPTVSSRQKRLKTQCFDSIAKGRQVIARHKENTTKCESQNFTALLQPLQYFLFSLLVVLLQKKHSSHESHSDISWITSVFEAFF